MHKYTYLIMLTTLFLIGSPITTHGYHGEKKDALSAPGLEYELEYLVSTGNSNRHIDTVSFNLLKKSHQKGRLAFYKGMTITRAWGEMSRLGVTSSCEAWGIGPTYLMRINVKKWDKAALFLDMSGALIFWDTHFPTNGDIYDFMWRIGPKFCYFIDEDTVLTLGYKLMHVSNGQWNWSSMEPTDNNPSYNAQGLSLMIMHYF